MDVLICTVSTFMSLKEPEPEPVLKSPGPVDRALLRFLPGLWCVAMETVNCLLMTNTCGPPPPPGSDVIRHAASTTQEAELGFSQ